MAEVGQDRSGSRTECSSKQPRMYIHIMNKMNWASAEGGFPDLF